MVGKARKARFQTTEALRKKSRRRYQQKLERQHQKNKLLQELAEHERNRHQIEPLSSELSSFIETITTPLSRSPGLRESDLKFEDILSPITSPSELESPHIHNLKEEIRTPDSNLDFDESFTTAILKNNEPTRDLSELSPSIKDSRIPLTLINIINLVVSPPPNIINLVVLPPPVSPDTAAADAEVETIMSNKKYENL